jgi:translation initiation factor IF-2
VYTVKRGNKMVLEESTAGDATLRRFKDVVSSVASGLECGLSLESYSEFQEGDVIECYKIEHGVKIMRVHDDANTGRGEQGNKNEKYD